MLLRPPTHPAAGQARRPSAPRRAVGPLRAVAALAVGAVAATSAVASVAAPAAASGPALASSLATTVDVATATTASPLSWAPPQLTNPITVNVSATNRDVRLSPDQDYIIQMPSTPLSVVGGLIIAGGRNVVLVGGEIDIPAGAGAVSNGNRGLYLKAQTGTIHIEGLRIAGAGLGEGINFDQRAGAVVQLQNIRVETVQGSAGGHHADVIQTWAGPRVLRVDGLSGSTQYQGFFLLPKQYGTQPEPEMVDLRRVDLRGSDTSAHMIWRDSRTWPMQLTDVWLAPRYPHNANTFLWPNGTGAGTEAWPSVKVGTPPEGEFVPAGTAGVGYVSPGYATSSAGVAQEPLTTPAISVVTGARASAGSHYTRSSSVELTWSSAGPSATRYDVVRDGSVVASSTAPSTRTAVPLVAGTNTLTVVAKADGQPDVVSAPVTVVVDTTAPTFSRGPELRTRPGTVSTAGVVPLTVHWSAADESLLRDVTLTSPVKAGYPAVKTIGYVNVGGGTKTWNLVARDEAGNTRSASASRSVTVVPETSAQRTGTWSTVTSTSHIGGAALRSSAAGATMTYTFEGRSFAWNATRTTTTGRVHIWVDGRKATTLDTRAGSTKHRQAVFTRHWSTSGKHTVQLIVEGTSGRPSVISDGFTVVR